MSIEFEFIRTKLRFFNRLCKKELDPVSKIEFTNCITFFTISNGTKLQRSQCRNKAVLTGFDHPKFGLLEIFLLNIVGKTKRAAEKTSAAHIHSSSICVNSDMLGVSF
jgi:hypothetical protein